MRWLSCIGLSLGIAGLASASAVRQEWFGWQSFTPTPIVNSVGSATHVDGTIAGVAVLRKAGTPARAWVNMYTASGTLAWQREYPPSGPVEVVPTSVLRESTGNVLVLGTINGGATNRDPILLRYSPTGALVQVRRLTNSGAASEFGLSLVSRASGQVAVLAQRQLAGTEQAIVYRLSSTLTVQSATVFAVPGSSRLTPMALKVGPGDILVGAATALVGSSTRAYVFRVGGWSRPFFLSSSVPTYAMDVAIGGPGVVSLVVHTGTPAARNQAVVVRYDLATGSQQWFRSKPTAAYLRGRFATAIDGLGRVFMYCTVPRSGSVGDGVAGYLYSPVGTEVANGVAFHMDAADDWLVSLSTDVNQRHYLSVSSRAGTAAPIGRMAAFDGALVLRWVLTSMPAGFTQQAPANATVQPSTGAMGLAFGVLGGPRLTVARYLQSAVAQADNYAIPVNGRLTVPAPGVLGNDWYRVGATISLVQPPTNGSASLSATGALSYRPNTGFTGTETIRYRLTKPGLNSSDGVVTIRVGL